MRIFATFDDAGRRVGTYPSDIYPDDIVYGTPPAPTDKDPDPVAPIVEQRRNAAIPGDAVEISVEQWRDLVERPDTRRWDGAKVVDYTPPPLPVAVPDSPTLSDWRVALTLWKRDDGTLRIDEVTAKVAALVDAGDPLGRIARERLEYANTVLRVQLMQLAGALGFTEAEIDESLWRADRVRQDDLSGAWPLPADKGAAA